MQWWQKEKFTNSAFSRYEGSALKKMSYLLAGGAQQELKTDKNKSD